MAERQSQEEAFRSSLEDVLEVASKLSSHCNSVEDLIGVVQLALANDGQLRLLMATVTAKGK